MNHEDYFKEAALEAKKATCFRAKCGAVVVLDDKIIGRGYNSPAGELESQRTCDQTYDLKDLKKPKSDRTCCVHAEWRTINEALKSGKDITGGILYFTRVDETGRILKSGKPYCTVCSRLALDVGLSKFALWHDDGIKVYETAQYNELSYRFHRNDA